MNVEKRTTNLEEVITHLEETVRLLNQVVTEQSRQLEALTKFCQRFSTELRDVREQMAEKRNPDEERPPHY
ncbi:SlyX family protein [Blastopirellula retiformator]|uniref:Protein SlyX n=1 Tax=Blastopirellula retiformator TaxID=2527970 RepID=A0A5C5VL43_9BACT|nr:SlyX family protein [Blastopirellula retiformator]TWT38569.1 hypothetical protein Enr8_02620 [Blastopirellula retiformator]